MGGGSMKLWRIWQDFNNDWDTYDSAVVAAETKEDARRIEVGSVERYGTWAPSEHVKVEYLGEAKPGTQSGVILASFNAG